jgi:hypothetical protein
MVEEPNNKNARKPGPLFNSLRPPFCHRSNMDDIRSTKFIWAPCIQLKSLAVRLPIPPHLGLYPRALLVSQDRRRLFVTPCFLWNHPVPAVFSWLLAQI